MTPHPDSCPDKLSELAILTQGTAGIPTVIPTKCRDWGGHLSQNNLLRQESRQFGGIRNRDSGGRSDHARRSALLSG